MTRATPSVQEEASLHTLDEVGTWLFLFLSPLLVSYASFYRWFINFPNTEMGIKELESTTIEEVRGSPSSVQVAEA